MAFPAPRGRRLLVELSAPPASKGTLAIGDEPGEGESAWVAAAVGGDNRPAHPWDEAHAAVAAPKAFGLQPLGGPTYAEPDLIQRFAYRESGAQPHGLKSLAGAAAACTFRGPSQQWPGAGLPFAWHLGPSFSGLALARQQVGAGSRSVRIAILDTGYDPEHASLPAHLRRDLQRNFVGDDHPDDATDPGRHVPLSNPGHGTATMALLAGGQVQAGTGGARIVLGGAPATEVVPVRIADSVIHFYTSAMASGIDYAIAAGCDVISISMGGVPTRAWAAAVNRAYEAGVAIFAAAGNRIGPSPPYAIVYPARFERVVAVCGATAEKTAYFRPGLHRQMQGCFGPPAKMKTALAAYTPNMPWAALGCGELIHGDGAGTSSATPQVAAAAALWLQAAALPAGVAPWKKVEAVRHALFTRADRSAAPATDVAKYFGNGLLRADRALAIPFRDDLPQTPPASVAFPWLRMAGLKSVQGPALMVEVEALQLFESSAALHKIAGEADPLTDPLSANDRRRLACTMRKSPQASRALREHLAALERTL